MFRFKNRQQTEFRNNCGYMPGRLLAAIIIIVVFMSVDNFSYIIISIANSIKKKKSCR